MPRPAKARSRRAICPSASGWRPTPRWPQRPQQPIDLVQTLEQIETELIQKALERAKGNKSRAAELLGLSRPRLYRRLVQLGLSAAEELVEFEELP